LSASPVPNQDLALLKTMKNISTVCARDCYDTCSLLVELDDSGQIVSIKGDPHHPMTQGFVCPRGAKDRERLYTNRVDVPFVRQGNDFAKASWDTSLHLIAQQLQAVLEKYGPEAALYLDYSGNTGLLTEIFPRRLWYVLGATQTDHAVCSKSGHTGLELHYGESYGVTPDELPEMKLIVFWGFNAAVSSPHLWALARKAQQSGQSRIVVIDPVKTQTAQHADLWLQPRPGSDVALAYGIINCLIQKGFVDTDFIAKWTQGFEQLTREATTWTPERVTQTTGVAWKQVEQLGELYYHFKPSATMIGIGLQKCDQGADQVRAVSFIPAVLGLHRGFFYSNGQSYLFDDDPISGKSLTSKQGKIVSQVGLGDLVQQGQFKFIYVNGMNPAMTLPNLRALREGLTRDDVFLVVHDTHWTKTADYADVVLPAPTYLEKDDLPIPWTHNLVRYAPQVVAPITDSRREIWVMQELANRLGLKEAWLYEDPWQTVEIVLKDTFEDGDVRSLKSGTTLRLKRKSKASYATSLGKIEFYASQAVAKGFAPLPVQSPLSHERGQFVYLTSASPRYTSTQFQEVYDAIPAIVVLNSLDATWLAIEDGDVVMLSNELGSVTMKASVADIVPERVVWSPRQFEGLNGEPQNCLMSSVPQTIGKGPRFHSTTITITKVA
jgi:anaerobic selenocysteine-containing dehydrogenase